ncbi:MAG: hypothetical protein O3A63_18345 [Proteobacteria bacterium]|nr:hypothetical protein [Pseudomonadota bacterium]
MLIKGAHVGLEFQGLDIRKNSNLQKLLDNLNQTAGETPSGDATDDEAAVKVIIDQLDFTGAKATVRSDLLGQIEIDVPNILLRDIGRRENGVVAGEAIRQLMEPLLKVLAGEVAKKSTGVDVDQLKDQAESELKRKFGDSLKKLVN